MNEENDPVKLLELHNEYLSKKVYEMLDHFINPRKNKFGTTDKYVWHSKWLDIDNGNGQDLPHLLWKSRTQNLGRNEVKRQCWNLAVNLSRNTPVKAKHLYRYIKRDVKAKIQEQILKEQLSKKEEVSDDTKPT